MARKLRYMLRRWRSDERQPLEAKVRVVRLRRLPPIMPGCPRPGARSYVIHYMARGLREPLEGRQERIAAYYASHPPEPRVTMAEIKALVQDLMARVDLEEAEFQRAQRLVGRLLETALRRLLDGRTMLEPPKPEAVRQALDEIPNWRKLHRKELLNELTDKLGWTVSIDTYKRAIGQKP